MAFLFSEAAILRKALPADAPATLTGLAVPVRTCA